MQMGSWLETPSIISRAAPAQVLWRRLPTPRLRRWGSCLMLWLHPSLSVCTCCIRWDTLQWLFPRPSRHTPQFPLHPASLKVQRTVIRDPPTAQVPPRAPSCLAGDAARPGKAHLALYIMLMELRINDKYDGCRSHPGWVKINLIFGDGGGRDDLTGKLRSKQCRVTI